MTKKERQIALLVVLCIIGVWITPSEYRDFAWFVGALFAAVAVWSNVFELLGEAFDENS